MGWHCIRGCRWGLALYSGAWTKLDMTWVSPQIKGVCAPWRACLWRAHQGRWVPNRPYRLPPANKVSMPRSMDLTVSSTGSWAKTFAVFLLRLACMHTSPPQKDKACAPSFREVRRVPWPTSAQFGSAGDPASTQRQNSASELCGGHLGQHPARGLEARGHKVLGKVAGRSASTSGSAVHHGGYSAQPQTWDQIQ